MKMKKVLIFFLVYMIVMFLGINNIVKAVGAMDSKPGVTLGPNPPPAYAPGQQIQQEKEEEAKKEEEEKKKQNAEEKKKYSDKEKKKFSADEINEYVGTLYKINSGGVTDGSIGKIDENKEVLEAWEKTLKKAGYPKEQGNQVYNAIITSTDSKGETVYKYPNNISEVKNEESSLEDMMSDADKFIKKGKLEIEQSALTNFSKTMYNILLAVGIVVAVIIGGILGIRIMLGSIDQQAEAKKLLVPYGVGCFVVFGGFGIWKLVVTILQNI